MSPEPFSAAQAMAAFNQMNASNPFDARGQQLLSQGLTKEQANQQSAQAFSAAVQAANPQLDFSKRNLNNLTGMVDPYQQAEDYYRRYGTGMPQTPGGSVGVDPVTGQIRFDSPVGAPIASQQIGDGGLSTEKPSVFPGTQSKEVNNAASQLAAMSRPQTITGSPFGGTNTRQSLYQQPMQQAPMQQAAPIQQAFAPVNFNSVLPKTFSPPAFSTEPDFPSGNFGNFGRTGSPQMQSAFNAGGNSGAIPLEGKIGIVKLAAGGEPKDWLASEVKDAKSFWTTVTGTAPSMSDQEIARFIQSNPETYNLALLSAAENWAAGKASPPAPSTPAPSTPAPSTPDTGTPAPAPVVPPGYFEQEAQRQRDQAVTQELARGNAASQQAISTGTPLNYTPAPVDLDAISVQQPASLAATSTPAPTWSTQQIADAGTFIAKNLSDPAKIEAKRKEIEQATGRDISVSDILAASRAANLSVSGALADIWSGDKYGPITTQDYYNWINQGVMDRPEFSGQEAQAAMKRFGISGEDITRARALDPRFSAGAQFALTTPTYEESGKTGFAALNQKLRDYIQQNAGAIKPEQARERLTQMLAAGTLTGGQALNEYDVQRATGKTLDELFKEATKPKPFVPPPPIDIPAAPSRPVNKIDVPGIDTAFRESPVRTFNPATGTFQYTNPTKLAPATGSGTSWVPPVITSRQRQLLNVGFRDDITTPTYDAVSNMLYQPAASSSQRFAADRSAQMRALQQLRTSVPMGSSTFLQLQSRLRSGEFGGVGGRPVDAAALEAAAKGYAAPTTKIATVGDKYFEKYPDVAETYAKLDAAAKAQFRTPSDYAQYHYDTYGRAEGREMPTLFAHGGPVVKKQSGGDVSRGTSSPVRLADGSPNPDEVPSVIDEREEIRSESQRMLNRLSSQSKLPPGLQRTIQGARARQGESMVPAAVPARDVMAGMFGAQAMNPGSEAYRTGQALANSPPVEVLKAPAKIASAAGDAATALASLGGAGVIKSKGGNWFKDLDSVEHRLTTLLKAVGARNFSADEVLAEMNATYTPEAMARLSPESLAQVERAYAELKPAAAINQWVKNKLTKYIKNEMGTPEDPVRALAERGVLHIPTYDFSAVGLGEKRQRAGMPMGLQGQSREAQFWEQMADRAIDFTTPSKIKRASTHGAWEHQRNYAKDLLEENPWIEKIPANTKIYKPSSSSSSDDLVYDAGFGHLIDELENAMSPQSGLPDSLRIQPKDLEKITVPQAVERVAKINDWRINNKKALAIEETNKADLYKAYPEQKYRWIQLNKPGQFAAESDAMGHSVRGYEPPEKGGSPFYGLGGWGAIQSGEAKVYSLRDAKGQSHATIEVKHDISAPDEGDIIAEMERFNSGSSKLQGPEGRIAYDEAMNRIIKSRPAVITQIKGEGNKEIKKEFLPFAQDFVRSGNWSEVKDLLNANLIAIDRGGDLAAAMKAENATIPKYVTQEEFTELLRKYKPYGYKHGGPVDKTTAFIKAHA